MRRGTEWHFFVTASDKRHNARQSSTPPLFHSLVALTANANAAPSFTMRSAQINLEHKLCKHASHAVAAAAAAAAPPAPRAPPRCIIMRLALKMSTDAASHRRRRRRRRHA